jgi:hypothetical protein
MKPLTINVYTGESGAAAIHKIEEQVEIIIDLDEDRKLLVTFNRDGTFMTTVMSKKTGWLGERESTIDKLVEETIER